VRWRPAMRRGPSRVRRADRVPPSHARRRRDRTAEDGTTAGVTCVNRLFEANYFVPRDPWKHPDHQRTPTLNHTFSD
jgi:hypothetical protein